MRQETIGHLVKRNKLHYRKIYAISPQKKKVPGYLVEYGLSYYCIRYDAKKSFKIKNIEDVELRFDDLDIDKKYIYGEFYRLTKEKHLLDKILKDYGYKSKQLRDNKNAQILLLRESL